MNAEPAALSPAPDGAGQAEGPPLAIVRGEPLTLVPRDLYIPPDALEVFLETFEGPLDLLLYLIKRQNLDILDIPIAEITRQYMGYIELMQEMRLELAAEYLVMAAMLAEIKSRMLLPRSAAVEDEDDPRAELVRRLQEYEQFKQAAQDLDDLPRLERDLFPATLAPPPLTGERPLPEVGLDELLLALREVLQRADMFTHHQIRREPLSVRERMSRVLEALGQGPVPFAALFTLEEGRRGVVVTFLAVLELLKAHLVELAQAELFAPIYLSAARRADVAHDT
ncbi:segregation and condensation protein A [Ectothiorhodospira lacustris]|uniref:segregation and condensation protein A n=1 Tax=Ectothiorhodospira lacustris TaxID=2899127 RepID=UPI001EE8734A|nr:ScpA family protein [Ectothiorhodospira lacustris]MCG5500397.1 segregation/condensation protein A [Ectothiorhodospira lacustris]MCG5510442.1 segregation/condensation protein A [Ectothiorhodospira lacustris]MCG5522188.1 segregation/condensation protein A [Ectothiorhodospira lacustris]